MGASPRPVRVGRAPLRAVPSRAAFALVGVLTLLAASPADSQHSGDDFLRAAIVPSAIPAAGAGFSLTVAGINFDPGFELFPPAADAADAADALRGAACVFALAPAPAPGPSPAKKTLITPAALHPRTGALECAVPPGLPPGFVGVGVSGNGGVDARFFRAADQIALAVARPSFARRVAGPGVHARHDALTLLGRDMFPPEVPAGGVPEPGDPAPCGWLGAAASDEEARDEERGGGHRSSVIRFAAAPAPGAFVSSAVRRCEVPGTNAESSSRGSIRLGVAASPGDGAGAGASHSAAAVFVADAPETIAATPVGAGPDDAASSSPLGALLNVVPAEGGAVVAVETRSGGFGRGGGDGETAARFDEAHLGPLARVGAVVVAADVVKVSSVADVRGGGAFFRFVAPARAPDPVRRGGGARTRIGGAGAPIAPIAIAGPGARVAVAGTHLGAAPVPEGGVAPERTILRFLDPVRRRLDVPDPGARRGGEARRGGGGEARLGALPPLASARAAFPPSGARGGGSIVAVAGAFRFAADDDASAVAAACRFDLVAARGAVAGVGARVSSALVLCEAPSLDAFFTEEGGGGGGGGSFFATAGVAAVGPPPADGSARARLRLPGFRGFRGFEASASATSAAASDESVAGFAPTFALGAAADDVERVASAAPSSGPARGGTKVRVSLDARRPDASSTSVSRETRAGSGGGREGSSSAEGFTSEGFTSEGSSGSAAGWAGAGGCRFGSVFVASSGAWDGGGGGGGGVACVAPAGRPSAATRVALVQARGARATPRGTSRRRTGGGGTGWTTTRGDGRDVIVYFRKYYSSL